VLFGLCCFAAIVHSRDAIEMLAEFCVFCHGLCQSKTIQTFSSCYVTSKKMSPARRDSSVSSRKLTQGKISDYVKPQAKTTSRSSSRRVSDDSRSSKNSPITKPSERRRPRDSSEESSSSKPSPGKKRQSSVSSASKSSSPLAKKSSAVSR